MRRGDIVLVRFPFASGMGGKVRPALVVQTDVNNRRLRNTIVAMISTSTKLAKTEPTQIFVDPSTAEGRSTGLLHPSAIKCENLFTIEQSLIARTIGTLPSGLMTQVNECLKKSLEIG